MMCFYHFTSSWSFVCIIIPLTLWKDGSNVFRRFHLWPIWSFPSGFVPLSSAVPIIWRLDLKPEHLKFWRLNSGGIFLAAMLTGEAIEFMLHHISHSACLVVFKWQWDRVSNFHKNSSTLALVWADLGDAICQR